MDLQNDIKQLGNQVMRKKMVVAINKEVSIKILVLAILLLAVQFAIAGEVSDSDETSKQISNNLSEEYVTCAAYYSIASEGIRRSGDLESAKKMMEFSTTALKYALIAAGEGRTQEMAEKVTRSRLELTMKSMTKEIDNDISNISILINEYGSRCKEVMENPDKAIEEWTEKILKRNINK